MIEILKKRFEDNMTRHPGLKWEDVEARLSEGALEILKKMEETGGEPDTIGVDAETGKLIFCVSRCKDTNNSLSFQTNLDLFYLFSQNLP